MREMNRVVLIIKEEKTIKKKNKHVSYLISCNFLFLN